MLLTADQSDLLRAFVKAYRRALDGSFRYVRAMGADGVRVEHDGLEGGRLTVERGDMIALEDAGMFRFSNRGAEDGAFTLTAEGLEAGSESVDVGTASGAEPSGTPEVFISHDSRDVYLARIVGDMLESAIPGISIFIAGDDLRSGDDWDAALRSALETAQVVVALLTPRSVASAWLHFEAGSAFVTGRLFPLCADGVTKGSLEPPMALRQARDLSLADAVALITDVAEKCGFPTAPPDEVLRRAQTAVEQAAGFSAEPASAPSEPAAPRPYAELGGVKQYEINREIVDYCPIHEMPLAVVLSDMGPSLPAPISEGVHMTPEGLEGQLAVLWWCEGDGGHTLPPDADDVWIRVLHQRAARVIEGKRQQRG